MTVTVLWQGVQHRTDLTHRYRIMRLSPQKRKHMLWFNQNGHLDKGGKIDGGGVQ
jgi:hypothetical protein